jgi:hypothetical protein
MSGKAGKLPKISWPATHPNGGRPRSTVVKGDPPAGRYTVWRAHTPVTAVTVTGGHVSSCHWPG